MEPSKDGIFKILERIHPTESDIDVVSEVILAWKADDSTDSQLVPESVVRCCP